MYTNVSFPINGYTRGFIMIVYTPGASDWTESLYTVSINNPNDLNAYHLTKLT